jgi:hypothetical protein
MGNTFYGNSQNYNGVPDFGSHRDELNNNEQVQVVSPTIGNWILHVQAKRLTESNIQNYSIVITAI